MQPPATPDPRRTLRARTLRALRRAAVVFALLAAAWIVLLLHPQPLFAYSVRRDNVVLYARAPFPAVATDALLDDVLRRVSRSPLYDPRREYRVFLCDTPAVFALFTLWSYRSGGVAETWLSSNAFIRPYDVQRGVLFGRDGAVKQGGRPLSYFVAHEITHVMTADRVGRVHFARLAAFQTEGYADYVAFARPLDFQHERDALVRDDPSMDPRRSGLYKRYELLVAYLLERRGYTVDQLLERPLDRRAVEAELLASPR